MLHKKQILTAIVALLATMGTLNAQEKYAIIIGGNMNPDDLIIPVTEQWNGGQGGSPVYGFDEFWNDAYLMWEMLIKEDGGKGFADANVHVLFGNGIDFNFPYQHERYTAGYNNYSAVTDANSNKQTISNTFSSLASTITEDDFLFVWIMSHGGTNAFGSYFYSYDNQKVYDTELASWLGNITAHKKVVFLSFPNSGGFVPELETDGNIVITSSGAIEGASRADDQAPTMPFIENEVRDYITYNHGEINYHLFSSLTGKTPFDQTTYAGTNLSEADLIPDGIIMISEVFYQWLSIYQTSTDYPNYSDPLFYYCLGTSLEYPTIIIEQIWSGDQVIVRGLIAVSNYLNVDPYAALTFMENASVCLISLISHIPEVWFYENSTLIIEDNVKIHSFSNIFEFIGENGANIQIGNNVTFSSDEYHTSSLVNFNSLNENYSFNELNIINCNFEIFAPEVEIINSYFEISKCFIQSETSSIVNSSFASSNLILYNNEICRVEDCNFDNYLPSANEATATNALIISHCDSYAIIGSEVYSYYKDGVKISYSGNNTGMRSIQNNIIQNNGLPSTFYYWSGILLYNSYADLSEQNNISGSDIGIQCLNNSQVTMLGNKNAVYANETQQIHDNNINQIFATEGSFPYSIRFNAIYDEDNNCLIQLETENEPDINVIYNFWGLNFDPEEDLCPAGLYTWSPVWNLQFLNENIASDEQMFNAAKTLTDSGDYAQAKTTYQQVAATYPSSKYATASLKELFANEQSAGNDYASLKTYYISLINQQANDELGKIADFLSNLCDIKLENFQGAISWYESVIQAPPSFADSLFAIIDLGQLYFLMEKSGYKSAITTNMPQYQPVSKNQHSVYSDYLLSLLFKVESVTKNPKTALGESKAAELLPNIPNPFWDKTTIRYVVNEAAYIRINMFDYSGRLVSIRDEGWKEPGQYQLALTSEDFDSCVYFCTIESNGMRTDSQKITVMK